MTLTAGIRLASAYSLARRSKAPDCRKNQRGLLGRFFSAGLTWCSTSGQADLRSAKERVQGPVLPSHDCRGSSSRRADCRGRACTTLAWRRARPVAQMANKDQPEQRTEREIHLELHLVVGTKCREFRLRARYPDLKIDLKVA